MQCGAANPLRPKSRHAVRDSVRVCTRLLAAARQPCRAGCRAGCRRPHPAPRCARAGVLGRYGGMRRAGPRSHPPPLSESWRRAATPPPRPRPRRPSRPAGWLCLPAALRLTRERGRLRLERGPRRLHMACLHRPTFRRPAFKLRVHQPDSERVAGAKPGPGAGFGLQVQVPRAPA